MLRRRNGWITAFVIVWTLVFHYETLRLNYLSPLAKRELPKLPLLFPPAGWIMFFNVDASYGLAEVYGLRRNQAPELLDPHAVLPTRAVGYDNIRRNVLVGILSQDRGPACCRYLHRKFPEYEQFAIVHAAYPDVINVPDRVVRRVAYRCE